MTQEDNLQPGHIALEPYCANSKHALDLLTRVLGLWFQAPDWRFLETDDGSPYVSLRDTVGDLCVIISRDPTGEYGVENFGRYHVPDLASASLSSLAYGLAKHYAAQWSGIAHIARRMMRETAC
jgi:hypothetical protein